MDIGNIPMHDWISLIVGILGLITAALSRSSQLPKPVRGWLSKIGTARIKGVIDTAQTFATKTPVERREWAAKRLQVIVREEFELYLPTSVANVLVEYAYQLYKAKVKR